MSGREVGDDALLTKIRGIFDTSGGQFVLSGSAGAPPRHPVVSRKGNCLDNAPMESFFGSLKNELIPRRRFRNRDEARRETFVGSKASTIADGCIRASAT